MQRQEDSSQRGAKNRGKIFTLFSVLKHLFVAFSFIRPDEPFAARTQRIHFRCIVVASFQAAPIDGFKGNSPKTEASAFTRATSHTLKTRKARGD